MSNPIKRLVDWWHRNDEAHEEVVREVVGAVAKWEQEMMNLPIDEAKRRAIPLLDDPTNYRCERAPLTDDDRRKLQLLPLNARSLFEEYKSIDAHEGDEVYDRADITEIDVNENGTKVRYIKIGEGAGGHDSILVKPLEEDIYLLGDSSYGQSGPVRLCGSIYHYLLYEDTVNKSP
jgi:hypothetical protein